LNRDRALEELEASPPPWDLIVVGGGATGLGCAVDAASRGYRTLLLEQHDFAKGTSSRSTKLVHGGVRYLKQGNIGLVLEALEERGRLCRNAPHLVRNLSFVIPSYSWWEGPFYGIGMKVYDRLAGRLGLSPSRVLSREETLERIPTVEPLGLVGGVSYHDGQFDDARLAVNLAQTVWDLGGSAVNYVRVVGLLKDGELVSGVAARDEETGRGYELRARAVINATGVYTDGVRRMDETEAESLVVPSQGSHLVLPKSFLPGDSAIMVPRTEDGRVLFAVPWHDRVVVGTTDTPVEQTPLEPRPLAGEIEFLLSHAARYLDRDPRPSDVLSVFAGLRPLVRSDDAKDTASLSRDHAIVVSMSGLLSVTGGKWTTYRKMAQDAVDRAETVAGFDPRPCRTQSLQIHGWTAQRIEPSHLDVYGADARDILDLARADPDLAQPLSPELPLTGAEVVWAARREMARTVEDVLARRSRALLLGARASLAIAPKVAAILARELGRGANWEVRTVEDYEKLAEGYLIA
jgi:glycerol-3-phosphate dehydrogenase